jgi:hypothetical protein
MLESAVFWGCVLLLVSFVLALAPESRRRPPTTMSGGRPADRARAR